MKNKISSLKGPNEELAEAVAPGHPSVHFEVALLIDAVFDALSNAASAVSISSENSVPPIQILSPGRPEIGKNNFSSLKGRNEGPK